MLLGAVRGSQTTDLSSAGGWTDDGSLVRLTTSTDNVGIGTASNIAKLGIVGDANEVQFLVRANATQTAFLSAWQNSGTTNVFTITNAGDIVASGTGTITGLLQASSDVTINNDLRISDTTGDIFHLGVEAPGLLMLSNVTSGARYIVLGTDDTMYYGTSGGADSQIPAMVSRTQETGTSSIQLFSDRLNFTGHRNSIANTSGISSTIQTAGASVGATDKAAGNLILSTGISTGSSTAAKISFRLPRGGTSGTTDNDPYEHVRIEQEALTGTRISNDALPYGTEFEKARGTPGALSAALNGDDTVFFQGRAYVGPASGYVSTGGFVNDLSQAPTDTATGISSALTLVTALKGTGNLARFVLDHNGSMLLLGDFLTYELYGPANIGIGVLTSPTASLEIRAGTTALGPLRFTAGTDVTTPLAGLMEYDGTQLYFSPSTTRNALIQDNGTRLTSGRVPIATTSGYLLDDADLTFTTDSLTVTKINTAVFDTEDGNHIETKGAAPTLSACGGGTPSINAEATDMAGKITVGTGVVTSCTLTFATAWDVAPNCVINNESQILVTRGVSTVSTLVIDAAVSIDADVISYVCVGNE